MTEKLMKGINIFVVLTITNFLWLIGLALGLFIFGMVPSTRGVLTIFEKDDLFDDYSYKQLIFDYFREYKKSILNYKWKVVTVPFLLLILYIELLFVQFSELAQAVFQIPLIVMMAILIFIALAFLVQEDQIYATTGERLRLAITLPFLTPVTVLLSIILFISFSVLSLRFLWFGLICISSFIFCMQRLLKNVYVKKGLIKN